MKSQPAHEPTQNTRPATAASAPSPRKSLPSRFGTQRFLTANWRDLFMLNYPVPAETLQPFLPPGTTPDLLEGQAFVNVVAFRFEGLRLIGQPVPLHQDFPEVNLRAFVQKDGQRGVMFLREWVTKPLITFGANLLYNEAYGVCPIRVDEHLDDGYESPRRTGATYRLRVKGEWHKLGWRADADAQFPALAHHDWFKEIPHGYGRLRFTQKALQYDVKHPRWRVYPNLELEVEVDYGKLFGGHWRFLNETPPHSAFVAEGSAVEVYTPRIV